MIGVVLSLLRPQSTVSSNCDTVGLPLFAFLEWVYSQRGLGIDLDTLTASAGITLDLDTARREDVTA